jgi:4,5-DOPA dioxygenase extradiol
MGSYRHDTAKTKSDTFNLGTLVHRRCSRDREYCAENNTRFWRLSARAVSGPVSRPGDRDLAGRVQKLLEPLPVRSDERWGLDHGTWSVLRHLYPQADIPVVQLSIDGTQPASFHYETGRRLAPLREEGVLILGSGNVVHNLHAYAWGRHAPEPYDWAVSFENRVRELLVAGEYKPLVNYEHHLGSEAELAVPTPDHYLPLLYVAGTRTQTEPLTFPIEGVDGGSVSMLTVQVG